MSLHQMLAFVILAATLAGCRPQGTAPAVSTAAPASGSAGCTGKLAFMMTTTKSSGLYAANVCQGTSLVLPDNSGPALDNSVYCDHSTRSDRIAWSPDGTRLLYVVYENFGLMAEVRVVDVATKTITSLTPPHIVTNAATGKAMTQICLLPDECVPGESDDGQKTFIDVKNHIWSPDGAQIAFQPSYIITTGSHKVLYQDYVVVNSDGTNARALSADEYTKLLATWSAHETPTPTAPQIDIKKPPINVDVGCATWHQ